MKRRSAQTGKVAGALRFAKRTVLFWETNLQDLGSPLLPRGPTPNWICGVMDSWIVEIAEDCRFHSSTNPIIHQSNHFRARSSKRTVRLISGVALDQCRVPERYRTRVPILSP